MALKIAQINAQRSAAASAELELLIKEKNIDILCMQEPYSFKNKVRGFNSPHLRVIQPSSGFPWAAAVVSHAKVNILVLPDISEHFTFFKVYTNACYFYFINVYCQYSLNISIFLDLMSSTLYKLRGERVILTLDSNCKSVLWGSDDSDDKGRLMEEFILENDLIILNEPDNPYTFISTNGHSNIDLTLATPNLGNTIKNWKVCLDCTTSDHNLIIFDIIPSSKEVNTRIYKNIERPFNLNRADWTGFENSIKEKFNSSVKNKLRELNPNRAVRLFNKLLSVCCSLNIPRKRFKENSMPWWNDELNKQRKKVNSYKKQLDRAIRLNFTDLIDDYKLKYKNSRNRYVAMIRKAKKNSWKNFVTKEGNREPWSLVYKIVRNQINKEEFLNSVILPTGEVTLSWRETVLKLLEKFAPKDGLDSETEDQKLLRLENNLYKNANIEPDISLDEIQKSVKKCKRRKAPGPDGFQAELILHLVHADSSILYILFNNCMRNFIFPNAWKIADLRIILKDPLKSKQQLNSYRPIALLSVVGKIFERILIERIQYNYLNKNLENPKQFGFRPYKSTEDALISLKLGVENCERKYALVIFIDIEAAFDGLWWPTIIKRLIEAECSSTLVKLIENYFKNRKILVTSKFEQIVGKMQKGCPQGSIIGPMAWVLCMDTFLDAFRGEFDDEVAEVIAYADDIAMILKGNSRMELESLADRGLRVLCSWTDSHKLKISTSKTVAMVLKGQFNLNRQPIIKIYNTKIKYPNTVKYLGITIDKNLNFINHSKNLRTKIQYLIMALRRVSRDSWGIKTNIIDTLYSAVFLPITTYGSGFWFMETQRSHVLRQLLATQRSFLLLKTRACRTTSTVALQVIAGALPLDLNIIRQALINKVRKNKTVRWKDYLYTQKENLQLINEPTRIKNEIKIIDEFLYNKWQQKWNNESRGRSTFDFIKNVKFKKENNWFSPNRFCTYIITGYGPINSSLFRRNCTIDKNCLICNLHVEETVNHIIFDCTRYESFRYPELRNLYNNKDLLINTKDRFKKFSDFISKVFIYRQQLMISIESSESASPTAGTGNVGFLPDG